MSGSAAGSDLQGVEPQQQGPGGLASLEQSSVPIPVDGPPASAPTALELEAVELELVRRPGPLLAQIQAGLAARGQVLRWAITAVEPGAGGGPEGSRLRLEAVVQR